MNKDYQKLKQFLEQQFLWSKIQDDILKEISARLYEMKKIADFALEHELEPGESDKLNGQLAF